MITEKKFLTARETSKLLHISEQTLANWRHRGEGLKFCKFGRSVRYNKEDIELFVENSRINTDIPKEHTIKAVLLKIKELQQITISDLLRCYPFSLYKVRTINLVLDLLESMKTIEKTLYNGEITIKYLGEQDSKTKI